MSNLGQRLERLAVVYRRREPAPDPVPSGFEPGRFLTQQECWELDRLLERVEVASRGRRRPDFSALSDGEVGRLVDLGRKARGLPPDPPPFFGMAHRDPGIGPCECRDCFRGPRPNARDAATTTR